MSKTSNILIFRGLPNSSTLRVTVFRFFVSIRLCFALQRWSIVSLSEFKSYYSFWREKWKYNQLLLSTFLFFNHGQDRNQKIAESIRTNPKHLIPRMSCRNSASTSADRYNQSWWFPIIKPPSPQLQTRSAISAPYLSCLSLLCSLHKQALMWWDEGRLLWIESITEFDLNIYFKLLCYLSTETSYGLCWVRSDLLFIMNSTTYHVQIKSYYHHY